MAIITKRSNHIPMLVVMLMMNITHRLVRMRLNQYSCGMIRLQVYIDHAAHQYGPNARFKNRKRS